jgi:hypothetical protein
MIAAPPELTYELITHNPRSVGASVLAAHHQHLPTKVGHILVGAQYFVALRAVAESRLPRGQA